jgi:hypothetical protein
LRKSFKADWSAIGDGPSRMVKLRDSQFAIEAKGVMACRDQKQRQRTAQPRAMPAGFPWDGATEDHVLTTPFREVSCWLTPSSWRSDSGSIVCAFIRVES